MARSKGVPKFQNPPLPPEPMKKRQTVEETIANVLTAIRQHEPEEQTNIFDSVMKELITDRITRHEAANNDRNRAAMNMEKFIATTQGLTDFIKNFNNRPDDHSFQLRIP